MTTRWALAAGLLLARLPFVDGAESPDLMNKAWPAYWIAPPDVSLQDYGVYHFRRSFDLAAVPSQFVVHVTGDNRYQLFVNGERVAWGPARGDLTHWRYETVDIASHLRAGKNVLAAVVWNDGPYKAIAQVTNETGFLLQADQPEDAVVNSDKTWKCLIDTAYTPVPIAPDQITGYHAVAAHEKVDGHLYPWNWEKQSYDDSGWKEAQRGSHGSPRDSRDGPNRWMLVPREIPPMEMTAASQWQLRKSSLGPAQAGGSEPKVAIPASGFPITIPAGATLRYLLDRGELTTAFPELSLSGGNGAQVRLRYAETLFITKGSRQSPANKGNRNDVEGKQFYGYEDVLLPDGGDNRVFAPRFWRTYRYIELDVTTSSHPVTLSGLRDIYTGYPFQAVAQFSTSDAGAQQDIGKILKTGFHTARLCAHETYMDCPYYEQLQYGGDARIQMMVSLYMTGDARLMRNGIGLLNSSRTAEGATLSRAPSYLPQYIPPFSMWWIGMVHDYWMHVDDVAFVKDMLPGVHAVLSFYQRYQKPNGSLKSMPWWNYVDWVKAWPNGEAPAEADGSSSAPLDLQLLLAYRWAADLETALGSKALAAEYQAAADQLKTTILLTDWDAGRGLFADQPSHRTFSQHANTLAVLAHLLPEDQTRSVMEKTLTDKTLAQATIYYSAYVNAALREAGLGDRYLDQLGPWREMLADGLTTWAEWSGPDVRSDCHAWGASPNFEIFRTIAGIETSAPGYSRVRIAPNLGKLHDLHASVPHPKGSIDVELTLSDGKLTARVKLPPGTPGEFIWHGQKHELQAGENHLTL
jgi:alpha-L-rhamnosidase